MVYLLCVEDKGGSGRIWVREGYEDRGVGGFVCVLGGSFVFSEMGIFRRVFRV